MPDIDIVKLHQEACATDLLSKVRAIPLDFIEGQIMGIELVSKVQGETDDSKAAVKALQAMLAYNRAMGAVE